MTKRKASMLEDEAVSEVVTASVDQLNVLNKAINDALAKQREIDTVSTHLSELNKEYQTLTVTRIPQLMQSAGVEEFKMEDGTKIEVKDFINGTLPKDEGRRRTALDWIEAVGAGGLIKEAIDFSLPRGSRELSAKIKAQLKKLKIDYDAAEGIHPQTLYAFARERMKKGESVPTDLLGLFIGQVAKITPPKENK